MNPAPEVLEAVRTLASAYIRGDKTSEEVRAAARADDRLEGILASLMGVSSFPQELLEESGIDPFTSEVEFDPPLAITREGLTRNLRLAMEGKLTPEALSDWVTDWFSWQIAARPDDEVVLELAGELLLGEEAAEEVLASAGTCDLFLWHLRNTPSALSSTVSFGLVLVAHITELEELVTTTSAGELTEEAAAESLRRIFRENLEAFPSLENDFLEAVRSFESISMESAGRFLQAVAKNADPLSAVEEMQSGS